MSESGGERDSKVIYTFGPLDWGFTTNHFQLEKLLQRL